MPQHRLVDLDQRAHLDERTVATAPDKVTVWVTTAKRSATSMLNGVVPSLASSKAARVARALPRSALRTTSSTRISRASFLEFSGLSLAQK